MCVFHTYNVSPFQLISSAPGLDGVGLGEESDEPIRQDSVSLVLLKEASFIILRTLVYDRNILAFYFLLLLFFLSCTDPTRAWGGEELTTEVYALEWNRTYNPSVCRPMLLSTEPNQRGHILAFQTWLSTSSAIENESEFFRGTV